MLNTFPYTHQPGSFLSSWEQGPFCVQQFFILPYLHVPITRVLGQSPISGGPIGQAWSPIPVRQSRQAMVK